MSVRGIASSSLMFQVRTLAQILSEKASLSEIETHQHSLRKELPSDPRLRLEAVAEDYLRAHVLPNVDKDKKQSVPRESGKDHIAAVWKVLTDMEETLFPATLMACLILNLRDAGKSLKDIDHAQEVPVDRLLKVLAQDVYTAKARGALLCQGGGLSNEERVRLKREATVALELLDGLCALSGVSVPSDSPNHKVALLEEAQKKL
ncbi:MAG: hypothetical protein AB7E52_06580 [Bdellovibrionales bacterium]